jgi:putative peptide zinc metalloprotease protein
MEEPDIAAKIAGSEASIRGYEGRLAGMLADPSGLAQDAVTRQRLGVEFQQARAARNEMARLNLQAPFAGRWMDVNPDWKPGQWINTREPIGVLVDPQHWLVDAYVKQDEVQRLTDGGHVRFYPEGVPRPIEGQVVLIGTTRISQLEQPMLASRYGGPLNVNPQGEALVPNPALFHVLVKLDSAPPGLRETRGHLQIEGARRSWLGEGFTRLLAVALRESGF